jgi:hypothetical protein
MVRPPCILRPVSAAAQCSPGTLAASATPSVPLYSEPVDRDTATQLLQAQLARKRSHH